MKKILHCLSSIHYGGTEMAIYNYLSAMDKSELDIHILVLYKADYPMAKDFEKLGCTVHYLTSKANSFFARPKELKQFFLAQKFDIVHINSMSASKYRYAKIAKKAGVKQVIYHSHGAGIDGIYKILHNLGKSKLNKWCDKKYACSQMAGEFMYNGEFEILNNAIDLEKFAFNEKERSQLRKQYNCEDKLVIGCVGRLTAVKNHKYLIEVAKALINKGEENFIFVLCGDGEMRNELMMQIENENLTKKFIFAGLVKDVYRYYNMFDVMTFPSHHEGFGIVMLEGQANGCAVIGSTNIPEQTIITGNAIRLPIGDEDIEKWADKLVEFAKAERVSGIDLLRKQGFDIKTEAEKLRKNYLS